MADRAVERLILAQLQEDSDWPRALDRLAEDAAARGLLSEARDRAHDRTMAESQSSSQSSATIAPARVPEDFSQFGSWNATFYSNLRQELLRVLGRA
jgi:hypothetical protein